MIWWNNYRTLHIGSKLNCCLFIDNKPISFLLHLIGTKTRWGWIEIWFCCDWFFNLWAMWWTLIQILLINSFPNGEWERFDSSSSTHANLPWFNLQKATNPIESKCFIFPVHFKQIIDFFSDIFSGDVS